MKKLFVFAMMLFASVVMHGQEAPEGLFINSKAADFKATDQNGNELRLKDMLKKEKVVVIFYMGYWSPHCTRFLQRVQDSLQLIKDKGATVIAIGAEKTENVKQTVEKSKAQFPIVFDEELKIMKNYEVEYTVPENTITRYRNSGIDLEKINGNKDWQFLPVPAVYIIDKESAVKYRFFNTDYKKRPSVAEILKNL